MVGKSLRLFLLLYFVFILSSCATYRPSVLPPEQISPPEAPYVLAPPSAPGMRKDTYHQVGPGETLWRLSKMYDVKMEDIMRVNRLRDATRLEMGQRLLIPNAAPIRVFIPLYKSSKWKYIIIHHSATDEGNALSLYDIHIRRGFNRGLGYHFIIDNGTYGKAEGQIEVSPRWIKQQDGAHCRASHMNSKGIGVCLVGNFSEELVSEKQMRSLVYLVNILRKYYKIPLANILGHGQVERAATECPGLNFPWSEFKRRLIKEGS